MYYEELIIIGVLIGAWIFNDYYSVTISYGCRTKELLYSLVPAFLKRATRPLDLRALALKGSDELVFRKHWIIYAEPFTIGLLGLVLPLLNSNWLTLLLLLVATERFFITYGISLGTQISLREGTVTLTDGSTRMHRIQIGLSKINNIEFDQSHLGKFLNFGDILVTYNNTRISLTHFNDPHFVTTALQANINQLDTSKNTPKKEKDRGGYTHAA